LAPSLITLRETHKRYPMVISPRRRLVELLLGRTPSESLLALAPISLEIGRGESLGLIGRNGAGKSTLLQILAGVITPSGGTLSINGRVAALLDLGAGLAMELTGRENIALQGPLLGMNAQTLSQRSEEIIAFSELEEFIDQPVRTYSAGMAVRLGFSIATAIDPDLLIIDEALSVGDGQFAKKSFNRIMELKANGASVVFCSHVLYQVEKLCDRVLWLDRGRVEGLGAAADIIPRYTEFLEEKPTIRSNLRRGQNNDFDRLSVNDSASVTRIIQVEMLKNSQVYDSDVLAEIESGRDSVGLRIKFQSNLNEPIPHIAVVIHDINRKVIASTSSERDEITLRRDSEGHVIAEVEFNAISLLRGDYSIDVLLLCEQAIRVLEAVYEAISFRIIQCHKEIGVVSLPRSWRTF
jgi:lipopolysaccharide transport system ATP-binding protein